MHIYKSENQELRDRGTTESVFNQNKTFLIIVFAAKLSRENQMVMQAIALMRELL